MFVDAIGEVYRGDSDVFRSESRSKLSYLGRVRGYRDLTEGSNIDLGVSYHPGPSAALAGFQQRDESVSMPRSAIVRSGAPSTDSSWAAPKSSGAVRMSRAGLRAERVRVLRQRGLPVRPPLVRRRAEPIGRAARSTAAMRDSGGSLSLTFRPSEFSIVRGQYRRTRYAEGIDANELLLQFNFAIGAHSAHPF